MSQSYANHARWFVPYHVVLSIVLVVLLVGGVNNLLRSFGDPARLYNASLIVLLTVALVMTSFFARYFALRAQDRTIRAEENLRHFVMTGALLDSRLTMAQVIGLRFASDAEFVALARRAAEEGLSPDQIKRAVTTWRVDAHRV